MPRAARLAASPWSKLYHGYIDRLKKLGCIFCIPCHAYLAVTHDCNAFRPVAPELPREALAFAAPGRTD